MTRDSVTTLALAAALPALMLFSGCDRHDHDDHLALTRVDVLDRTDNNIRIAQWTSTGGWDVASLPTLTVGDETNVWGRSSWTIEMFQGGELIEMATIDNPGPDLPRVCTESSAQYRVTQTGDVLYDPGNTGLVEVGGETRNTFHCDHLHVYPQSAGTAEIAFLLWHVDHEDGRTDPIEISVLD